MKGVVLMRQLEATGVASPAAVLVSCLLSSARPVSILRGMATGAAGPSPNSENNAEIEDKRPTANVMAPGPSKQKWWRPDPETGAWVPEGGEGQVTTSTVVMKSPSRTTRVRTQSTASLEDKRWWTSMEELPDMDRANKPPK